MRVERKLPAADGTIGTLLTERAPLRRSDGSVYGIVTVGIDISDRLEAERELADVRERFEASFMNAPNGMALIALDGRFLRVNPAMCDLTGYPADELTTLRVADIAHPDDMEEQLKLVRRALAGEFENYSLDKRFTRKTGEVVWLMLSVSLIKSENDEEPYVLAQTINISARKQVEAALRQEAGLDPLTGLANRRQLERAIDTQLERVRRFGEKAALLMVDLDGFKEINDEHGHEVGDRVLKFFGRELLGQIRSTDMVARIGGDEFVLLMPGVGPERAATISDQLTTHFERVFCEPEGLSVRCAISVGHASLDQNTTGSVDALVAADRSMYDAKRARKSAGFPPDKLP